MIGQLKNRWPRLSKGGLFSYEIDFIDMSVTAICAVYNLTVDPQYAGAWPEVSFPQVVARRRSEPVENELEALHEDEM